MNTNGRELENFIKENFRTMRKQTKAIKQTDGQVQDKVGTMVSSGNLLIVLTPYTRKNYPIIHQTEKTGFHRLDKMEGFLIKETILEGNVSEITINLVQEVQKLLRENGNFLDSLGTRKSETIPEMEKNQTSTMLLDIKEDALHIFSTP